MKRLGKLLLDFLALGAIAVGAIVVCYLLAPHVDSKVSASCQPSRAGSTSVTKAQHGEPKKAILSVADNAATGFNLGRDVNSGVRMIPFSLDRPLSGSTRLRVSPGIFAPAQQDGRPLGKRVVKVWAVIDRSGTTGTAYLCITPPNRLRAPWGTFTGSFVFADSRIEPKTLPVTVTASYPKAQLVAIVGLAVCLLASLYVYFLRGAPAPNGPAHGSEVLRWPFAFLLGYWRYTTDMVGALTVAAGLIAACAAFTAQYLNAEVWSGDIGEWLTYAGAIATSFVAGGTAGRLAGNQYTTPLSQKPG